MSMNAKRLRIVFLVIVLAFAGVIVHDAIVPIPRQFSTRTLVAAIEQYRAHVSPHLKGRVFCRFQPTCSEYGLVSVKKYGALRGGARAAWRVLRCGPWTPAGTVDPP